MSYFLNSKMDFFKYMSEKLLKSKIRKNSGSPLTTHQMKIYIKLQGLPSK